jgi:hypothetical protein
MNEEVQQDVETIKSILIHVMESLAGRDEEELEEISERIQSGEPIAFRIGAYEK